MDKENDDSDALLSLVSSVSEALAHKFDCAHLFECRESALIPAKQQPRSALWKGGSGIPKHDWTRQDNEKPSSRIHARP